MGEQPQCSRIFLPAKYTIMTTMKNIYESILSSTNSGKSFMLSDPDVYVDITINAKNVSNIKLPVNDKTSIIKIKR